MTNLKWSPNSLINWLIRYSTNMDHNYCSLMVAGSGADFEKAYLTANAQTRGNSELKYLKPNLCAMRTEGTMWRMD